MIERAGATVPVNSSNKYLKELSKDADRIGPAEVLALSQEISDYVQNQLMANYLLNGEVALSKVCIFI